MPHRKEDDPRNVLLNEMNNPFPFYALEADAMERWNKVIKLRDVVNQALETARSEKKIGKSLEAKIVLTVPADETALDGMGVDALADILIVSQAELQKSGMNVLKVDVEPAAGQKCERCWKVLPTVGSDAGYPTLCPRCAKVVPAIEVE
jgi:isoleucyl-tRNA synthetase